MNNLMDVDNLDDQIKDFALPYNGPYNGMDKCEKILHEYDMKKMHVCDEYTCFSECYDRECPFQHIDLDSNVESCPWHDSGFCRDGPHCRLRHVRRVLCINYLAGFCPSGCDCEYDHPRFEIPASCDVTKEKPTCDSCDHKTCVCQKSSRRL